MNYDYYMKLAYDQALLAFEADETPVGCVIVFEESIIGKGFNLRNTKKNSLYHAEIIAINEACGFVNDWRLEGCTIFVTVEPCPMCAGAIVQSRIKEAVIGAYNKKAGCAGSVLNILNDKRFNHQVQITDGIMTDECAALMSNYFKRFRVKE